MPNDQLNEMKSPLISVYFENRQVSHTDVGIPSILSADNVDLCYKTSHVMWLNYVDVTVLSDSKLSSEIRV